MVSGEGRAGVLMALSGASLVCTGCCEGKRVDAKLRRRREHELTKKLLRLAAAEAR